jgi:hypothetical protein
MCGIQDGNLHKFNLHASDDANDDAGNYVGVSDDASDG